MEDIKMSKKERRRLEIISRVKDEVITLKKAAGLLGMSYRHMRRIFKRYKKEGDMGLIHKGRGKSSNRRIPENQKEAVLKLYAQKYDDFGPTLAAEQLAIRDGYEVNHETLRLWLIKEGLWKKKRRRKKHRSWRARRKHIGELVQMDGSHHDWFEGRAEPATLMVMVDDASGRTYARFADSETTRAAMEIFQRYTELYGLPQALYVDRHSIYRCERQATVEEELKQVGPLTQFGRAMDSLEVQIILAYSAQAKGRVERTNSTLQDRLIKEMRLEEIDTIGEGNLFLEEVFLPKYNETFNVIPQKEEDLHRQIPADIMLDKVLCFEEKRQVQNDWTVSWRNRIFQVSKQDRGLGLAKQYITVREKLDGTLQLEHRGHLLKFKEIKERPKKISTSAKPPSHSRKTRRPAPDHPWRNCSTRSSPQSRLDSDELGGAHSRRGAPMDNSSRVDSVQPKRGQF